LSGRGTQAFRRWQSFCGSPSHRRTGRCSRSLPPLGQSCKLWRPRCPSAMRLQWGPQDQRPGKRWGRRKTAWMPSRASADLSLLLTRSSTTFRLPWSSPKATYSRPAFPMLKPGGSCTPSWNCFLSYVACRPKTSRLSSPTWPPTWQIPAPLPQSQAVSTCRHGWPLCLGPFATWWPATAG